MALFLAETSACPLCKQIISDHEEQYAFPAFVPNSIDPLQLVNDATCHLKCLKVHENGRKAMDLAALFLEKISPGNRICAVGGNRIENPADYIFIDLLTSDENDPLFEYNFLTFDKNNLIRWKEREKFIKELQAFRDSGKWVDTSSYHYLDRLINLFE